MKTIYEIESNKNYLSEVIDTLPSHVLLNKGMVGCGGTTLELTCKRNSIVFVPTINLVYNKATGDILGVTGTVKPEDIKAYINKAKRVFSNPKVILNLSYGLVINGMFGLINFETGWQIMFFICLTAFGLIGIINTANVDE